MKSEELEVAKRVAPNEPKLRATARPTGCTAHICTLLVKGATCGDQAVLADFADDDYMVQVTVDFNGGVETAPRPTLPQGRRRIGKLRCRRADFLI